MPLTFVSPGETKLIKSLHGKDETRHFLESLGFVPGSEVSVVASSGGNVIVQIKQSRIAISRAMANKIMIGD